MRVTESVTQTDKEFRLKRKHIRFGETQGCPRLRGSELSKRKGYV